MRTREECQAAAAALLAAVHMVDDSDSAQRLLRTAADWENEALTAPSARWTLAEMQIRYLEVRQHTLSTAQLSGPEAMLAQARYVLDEAQELFDAVIQAHGLTDPNFTAHVRHEAADVVLATVTLANVLGVSVENCIEEKTEADRGRG